MSTVYEAAGGRDGLLRLAHAWHERVLADEVVAHAFSHGYRPDHTERLAAYWGEALGGPTTIDAGLADDDKLRRTLHDYFAWVTTGIMARYAESADDVPDRLALAHWSWDGPQVAQGG